MANKHEARLRERVGGVAPDLVIQTARLNDEGFDSDALIVNDQWVFRFPRRPDVAEQLAVEQTLLPALAPELPIAIPRYEIFAPSSADALPFVGYRMLPGTQLRAPLLAKLPAAARAAIAAQLGAFLSALHAFPAQQALAGAPTIRTTERDPIAEEYAAVEHEIFPLLTPAERLWAHALYATAGDQQIWQWEPVVTHNDLSSDHILFDPQTQRVSGIIDWGDVELGDAANDFAALPEYGQPFADAVLRHYAPRVDAAFLLRLSALLPRTIFRNLRYLVAHNHQVGIERNLRELRERTAARGL